MRKHLLSIILFVLVTIGMVLPAMADEPVASGTCGNNLTYEITGSEDEGYTLTIAGSGEMTEFYGQRPWKDYDYCIKSVSIGDGVTSIGNNAFNNFVSLTSVTLPESLKRIGSYAFSKCDSLLSISIPVSVTNIDYCAFYWCNANFIIICPYNSAADEYAKDNKILRYNPDGEGEISGTEGNISYKLDFKNHKLTLTGNGSVPVNTEAGDNKVPWYEERGNIETVEIGEGISAIGDRAFKNYVSLTGVLLPESLATIGECAFFDCNNLTSCMFPEKLTTIGRSAFDGCSSLTGIILPENLTTIGVAAFSYCSSIKYITLPKNLTTLGVAAFCDCSSLTGITFPDGLTTIEELTFGGCSSLTSITLPASLTTIKEHAFECCESLISATIPSSVSSIADEAFLHCKKVVIRGEAGSYVAKYAKDHNISFAPFPVITFDGNGAVSGSTEPIVWYDGTQSCTLTKNGFNRAGYTFCGWNTKADGSGTSYKDEATITNLTSSMTLYAQWKGITYTNTLKYDANGGSGAPAAESLKVTYPNTQSRITLSTGKPTRSGYTFAGWYTQKTGGSKVGSSISVGSNNKTSDQTVTVYAQWTKAYKITYMLDGGKNSSSNPSTYTKPAKDIELKNASKTGYIFAGWYTSSKFTKKVTKIAKGSTGDKTFYAKWKAISYKIKFNANGGKGSMKTVSTTYDKSLKLTRNTFTRQGYTFLGWSLKKTDKKATYKNQQKVKNLTKTDGKTVTLYAIWKKK